MINVRDASFQRIQGLSLPFQVRRDRVSAWAGKPLSGLGKE
jgi:hypothetical protein